MDCGDARFAAAALGSRIAGDRDELDRLHATSFVRLTALASRVKTLGAEWPPALISALELETIAMYGAKAADAPAPPALQIFVDKLNEILAEPRDNALPAAPRNRFERRHAVSGRTALKQRRAHLRELSRRPAETLG